MERQMRSNKINNMDLFTQKADEQFENHIKTQSKRSLEIINKPAGYQKLVKKGVCKIICVNRF
jgi:hypothetical protein